MHNSQDAVQLGLDKFKGVNPPHGLGRNVSLGPVKEACRSTAPLSKGKDMCSHTSMGSTGSGPNNTGPPSNLQPDPLEVARLGDSFRSAFTKKPHGPKLLKSISSRGSAHSRERRDPAITTTRKRKLPAGRPTTLHSPSNTGVALDVGDSITLPPKVLSPIGDMAFGSPDSSSATLAEQGRREP